MDSPSPVSPVSLRLLGDRVLVLPVEAQKETANGIVMPDSAKDRHQRGIVVELGLGRIPNADGVVIDPLDFLEHGQKVTFYRHAAEDMKVQDATGKTFDLKLMSLSAVIGISR